MEQRPRIVWVFIVWTAIWPFMWFLIWGLPPLDSPEGWSAFAGTAAIVVLVLYGFARGLRLVWWLLVIASIYSFVPTGQSPGRYLSAGIANLVSLGLLLAPSMRLYFFRRKVRTTPPS